jgi:hypothetical protein
LLESPPRGQVARRVVHGVLVVGAIMGVALQDPGLRGTFRRVVRNQALVTLLVTLAFTVGLDALPERVDDGNLHVKIDRGSGGWWGLLYGVLCVVEWVVIALSRDFHDEISRVASLAVGVPPEDPPLQPRVRVDLRWGWRKLKRRIHGALIFILGLPMLALALLVPVAGDVLYSLAVAGWGFYWVCVFTVGRTAFAWVDQDPREPWFLALWTALQARTSLLRWWLPRVFLRWWRYVTGVAMRPAALLERIPWEAAGLGLVRLAGGVPVLYLLIRPFIPVAAALLLKQHGLLTTARGPGEPCLHTAPGSSPPGS